MKDKYKKNAKKFYKKNATKSGASAHKALVKLIDKQVSKGVHKGAEDKIANVSQALTAYNSGVDVNADVFVLMPPISQGVDSADRIGLEITGKRHIVMGHIIMNTTFAEMAVLSNCRVAVRMLIVSAKQYPNGPQAKSNSAGWLPSLLENGNSVQALDGTIQSLYLPVNRKVATVHSDKVYYLNNDFAIQNTAVGGYSTGMVQTVKMFKASISCRKTMKYNDITSVSHPTNYGPVIILGYAHLDGSIPDVLTTNVSMACVSNFYYEDT